MRKISDFEKKIDFKFKNKNLIREAFLHKSYINEDKKIKLSHNERLEFLGDAVLELIVTEYLYKKYTDKAEGEMTAIRAALVNTDSLASVAKEIEMEDHLTLSKGERKESKGKDHTLANTFEAVLGAIYLDAGFEAGYLFVEKYLLKNAHGIVKNKTYRDPKSYFQERAQEKYKFTPVYKIISEKGKDHDKVFVSEVSVGEKKISQGEGPSKQKADIEAAKNGLEKEGWG